MLYSAKVIRCLIAFALSAFALHAEVRVAVVLPEGREMQAVTKVTWDGTVESCRCIERTSLRVRTTVIEIPHASIQRFEGKDVEREMRRNYGADVFSNGDIFDLVYLNVKRWSNLGDSDNYSIGDLPYREAVKSPTVLHEFASVAPSAFLLIIPVASQGKVDSNELEIRERTRMFNGFVSPAVSGRNEEFEQMGRALLRRMIFLALDPPARKRRRPAASFPKLTVHVRYTDGTTGKLKRLVP